MVLSTDTVMQALVLLTRVNIPSHRVAMVLSTDTVMQALVLLTRVNIPSHRVAMVLTYAGVFYAYFDHLIDAV